VIIPAKEQTSAAVALRRRISGYIADSAGCRTWRDSNYSKRCYAARRGIACSTNRKNRVLRVPATKQSAVKVNDLAALLFAICPERPRPMQWEGPLLLYRFDHASNAERISTFLQVGSAGNSVGAICVAIP